MPRLGNWVGGMFTMGIFDLFKKKTPKKVSVETVHNLVEKYFGGYSVLGNDAKDLLEMTKFDVSVELLSGLMIRCLGFIVLNSGWTNGVANTLRNDCQGKISFEDLKWLMVYVDLHYIHKNPTKEAMLLFELGGRKMGMPSPSGNISANYKFEEI